MLVKVFDNKEAYHLVSTLKEHVIQLNILGYFLLKGEQCKTTNDSVLNCVLQTINDISSTICFEYHYMQDTERP